MTSDATTPRQAYVWAWLPDARAPVVAGRLETVGEMLVFNYGRSYLQRDDAIALYLPELPLQSGAQRPAPGLRMAGCLRDAAPDAWGRRVTLNRRFGKQSRDMDPARLDELTYLLESGSDRVGALDFQTSPGDYVARHKQAASLTELQAAAAMVEAGTPLSAELEQALLHGTSLGGARPKAMIEDGQHKWIAKFSSASDHYSVVKGEYLAMRLAAAAGLDVAPVRLVRSAGKDVLLVRRFDRIPTEQGWQRKAMVSGLTLLGLDELMARYASYLDLAEIIRHRFVQPRQTLRELYGRMVFNVLSGNTDDHARNHAAFWDGHTLALTPAYDLCPQPRSGNEASQAMLIHGNDRSSRLQTCLDAAADFLLDTDTAKTLIAAQISAITDHFENICDEGGLDPVERNLFRQRHFLNPSIFDQAPEELRALRHPWQEQATDRRR